MNIIDILLFLLSGLVTASIAIACMVYYGFYKKFKRLPIKDAIEWIIANIIPVTIVPFGVWIIISLSQHLTSVHLRLYAAIALAFINFTLSLLSTYMCYLQLDRISRFRNGYQSFWIR